MIELPSTKWFVPVTVTPELSTDMVVRPWLPLFPYRTEEEAKAIDPLPLEKVGPVFGRCTPLSNIATPASGGEPFCLLRATAITNGFPGVTAMSLTPYGPSELSRPITNCAPAVWLTML